LAAPFHPGLPPMDVAPEFLRTRRHRALRQGASRDAPAVRLENVAIAGTAGERPFYRLGVDPEPHGRPRLPRRRAAGGSLGVKTAVDRFFGRLDLPVFVTAADHPWPSWSVLRPR
jgi:hypothetical protein